MWVISNLAIGWFFEIKIWCLDFGGIFAAFNLPPTHNNPALFINGDNGATEPAGLTCFSYFKLLISSLNDVFWDMRISSCRLSWNSAAAIMLKFSLVCSPLFHLIQFDFNFLIHDIVRISLSKNEL